MCTWINFYHTQDFLMGKKRNSSFMQTQEFIDSLSNVLTAYSKYNKQLSLI